MSVNRTVMSSRSFVGRPVLSNTWSRMIGTNSSGGGFERRESVSRPRQDKCRRAYFVKDIVDVGLHEGLPP